MRFLLEHAAAGLFLEPGLGKTSVVLAAAKILKKEHMLRRMLVIAPLRVCYTVWPDEQRLWTNFNELKIEILHGPGKDDALNRKADLYVINPDGLAWFEEAQGFSRLRPDTLVVDESSKFKHTDTVRFKLLKTHLEAFRRRWILTGTPVPNGYLDLFGQMYILDLGRSLGRYITHYRFNYFYPSGYGGYTWRLQEGAEEAIQEMIRPLVLRLDAEDYIEMPDVVENIIRVTLPAKARRLYDEMEEEMIAALDSGAVVTAMNAASASVKCRQIANGGLYYDPAAWEADWKETKAKTRPGKLREYAATRKTKREWEAIHAEKTEAVVDLLDELGGAPTLVMYDFHHDRERLLKALGKDTAVLGGGTSMKETVRVRDAWNRGELPRVLCHAAAMSHGLNLQHGGNHIIWHSLTYDYEQYDQTIRRIRRQGNKHAEVFVHHIVARDTVDDPILRTLKAKRRGQNTLLDALKDYAQTKRKKQR